MTYKRDLPQELNIDADHHWKISYLPLKKTSLVYKKCFLVLLLVFIAVYSSDSSAANCLEYYYTSNNVEPERNVVVYYADFLDLSTCTESVIVTPQEYARFELYEQQNGALFQVTAESSTVAFTFGMTTYLIFWFIGFKGRMARKAISQV
jgi:hypothetical protein